MPHVSIRRPASAFALALFSAIFLAIFSACIPAAEAQTPFDQNGDGYADTVRREIRLHQSDPVISRVVVQSGIDGSTLLPIWSKDPNDLFGWYVSPTYDFDDDGTADLIISAPASLIEDARPPEDPLGPAPTWRGRVVVVSGATGSELFSLTNPEQTRDSLFALAAVTIPDQDFDGHLDFLVGGVRYLPPPANDPTRRDSERRWWLMSGSTLQPIRFGAGEVGVPGCEFLVHANPPQTAADFWFNRETAGEQVILPGIAGDLDGDGDVDGVDALNLIDAWNGVPPDGPRATFGDLNGDGIVDSSDLYVLLASIGVPPNFFEAIGDPEVVVAHQDADLKMGRGPAGPAFETDPQCPWIYCRDSFTGVEGSDGSPPSGPPSGPPGGPPGDPPSGPPSDPPTPTDPDAPVDPIDPEDPSSKPAPSCLGGPPTINFLFGDGSGSSSETWGVYIGDHYFQSPSGAIEHFNLNLVPNQWYQIRIVHVSSTLNPPDYDYTLDVRAASGTLSIDDPQSLFGKYIGIDIRNLLQKRAWIRLIDPGVQVDSNNNGRLDAEDDEIENQETGAVLGIVNRFDTDGDDIPDFADGYGYFGPRTNEGTGGNNFIRIKVCLGHTRVGRNVSVSFNYSESPPWAVQQDVIPLPDIESEYRKYALPIYSSGRWRLWTRDGDEARQIADFVPSNRAHIIPHDSDSAYFYLEAVKGSPIPESISVIVQPHDGPPRYDQFYAIAFDPKVGLSNSTVIKGFEIIRHSGEGTEGRDIILYPENQSIGLINGLAGDDIIVVPPGDHIVYAGSGNDVVYASLVGNKQFYFDPTSSTSSAATAHANAAADKVESLEDAPLTTASLTRAYDLIFGSNDPWFDYFTRARGKVRAVAFTQVPPGRFGMWCVRDAPGEEGKKVTITFGLHDQSPFQTATGLREHILELAGMGPDNPCGLRRQIEGIVGDEIAFGLARSQLHIDSDDPLPPDPIQQYNELRDAAFDDALELTAYAAGLYVEAIRFVSSGADIVVSVAALADGDFEEAIGLLPLVPSALSGAKLVFRVGGTEKLNKVREFVDHFPCIGRSGCPTLPRWALERGVPRRSVRAADGQDIIVIGRGHYKPQSPVGIQHRDHSEFLATQRAADGTAAFVVQHRKLSRATGLENLGDQAGKFPDLVVVRRDGKIDLYEIQSCGDRPADIVDKLRQMMDAIPENLRGDLIPVFLEDYTNPGLCNRS